MKHQIILTLAYIYIYPDEPPQNTAQMNYQLHYKLDTRLPELLKTWFISMYISYSKIKSGYECPQNSHKKLNKPINS